MAPDHFYFDSLLRMAAVKRTVLEVRLVAAPEQLHKVFVNKAAYLPDGQLVLHTTSGQVWSKNDIADIAFPNEDPDFEAISCLCQ